MVKKSLFCFPSEFSIKASLYLTSVSEVINRIFPLIIFSVIMRRLGADAFGSAQYVINLLEFCVPLVALGYHHYGTLALGRLQPSPATYSPLVVNIVFLKILGASLTCVGIVILSFFFDSLQNNLQTILTGSFLLFATAIELNWVQIALKKTAHFALQQMFSKILFFGLLLQLVQSPDDYQVFVYLFLAINAFICLWTALSVAKHLRLAKPDYPQMRKILRESWIYGVSPFLLAGLDRLDLFLAEQSLGSQAVAALSSPLKLARVLLDLCWLFPWSKSQKLSATRTLLVEIH